MINLLIRNSGIIIICGGTLASVGIAFLIN